MKQINANVISDKLAGVIRTLDSDDKWLETTALIADSYKFIVLQMTEDADSCVENMVEWTGLLSMIAEYQSIIGILHEESKLSTGL